MKTLTPAKVLAILCAALILAGLLFIVIPNNHLGPNGSGITRANTYIEFGADFYTSSARYSALAANSLVDTYNMLKTAIGIFFIFVGSVGSCMIVAQYGNPFKKNAVEIIKDETSFVGQEQPEASVNEN